ncbi:hypothetical protein FOC4_g10006817 [Fusarium odoratissimum]|uniref:LysM domain-containing protein n=1 Tax=Fusarium oxysporum f. sp. cubense (strain race 4) TaxID=2502994 RepID=N1RQM2_FUSC4|nr:hypothetical protein FOC4_g10006817 [Fusarium odoratissimum]
MTEPRRSARPSPHRSSSALAPANTSDSTSIRPRNRRLASALDDDSDTATSREASRSRRGRNLNVHDTAASPSPARSYGLLTAFSPANSRSASPLPSERGGAPHRTNSAANLTNFFNDSLTQSWASIQGFTSSLLSGDNGAARRSQSHNRAGSRSGTWGRDFSGSGSMKKTGGAWGPAPPQEPNLNDVGAGSLAERETALKAARRAMVLESHDGVNGGLDVSGNHKRRNSDESTPEQPQTQEYLVYIHKVEPSDTYAGIILKYQCREDAFRKANGLWTRDSIQVRKWLTIPVDACDVRGRPCDPPSWHNAHSVDLLAPTPAVEENSSAVHDDFFSRPINGTPSATQPSEEDKPWTHALRLVARAPSVTDPSFLAPLCQVRDEGIPSMSVMGSETAHFGFKSGESSSIVENPSGEGQEIGSTQQGNGLDKAAAAVETWLRGALSRKPSSQLDRIRGMPEGSRPERNGDLIELTDTGSDDGRPSGAPPISLMESLQIKSSSRSEGEGGARGRMVAKGDKDD